MTAVDSDLDSFIRQQKTKLANERQTLKNSPDNFGVKVRRKWGPPIEATKEIERENYKKLWYQVKGRYLEPTAARKQWGSPVKLSPRGLLDTNALILDVQKEKERAEYEEMWRLQHGMEPSPRGVNNPSKPTAPPAPQFDSTRTQEGTERDKYRELWQQQHREAQETNMKRGAGVLDTAQIIREVEREKREEEERLRQHNPLLGGGGKPPVGKVRGNVDRDEYHRLWEQQNSKHAGKPPPYPGKKSPEKVNNKDVSRGDTKQLAKRMEEPAADQQFDDSLKNIQDKIAEAKDEADRYRKRWEEQKKEGVSNNRPHTVAVEEDVLPVGGYEDYRKKLNLERQKEYNEMLRQGKLGRRSNKSAPASEIVEDEALPIGTYDDNKRKLNEERRREYREMLMKKTAGNKQARLSTEEEPLPLGGYEENRRRLNEERRKEYNELQQRKRGDKFDLGLAPEVDESEEFGLFHNLGAEDKKLKEAKREPPVHLNLQGQNIYNKAIRKGYQARPLQEQTDEYKASTFNSNESDAAKLQKMKERNDEYNQFLATKAERDQNRFADKKSALVKDDGVYATIPGLRYSNSAQRKEKEAERNKEYNDMMRQKAQSRNPPKQGWGTPTYEEMLDKKRAQESQYRRANDIGLDSDPHVRETEIRIKELERDLSAAKDVFDLDTAELVQEYKDVLSRLVEFNVSLQDEVNSSSQTHARTIMKNYQDPNKNLLLQNPQDATYYNSLPLGTGQNEKQRRSKEEYDRALRKQMEESAYARKLEREQGLLINDNGIVNSDPALVLYDTRPRRKDPALEAYNNKILADLNKLDEISPRSNAILGRRPLNGDRSYLGGGINPPPLQLGRTPGSILDLGFDPGLDPPTRISSLNPPAGLQYQPSTYITANAVPLMNSSVDEAYNFYATRNPLDPGLNAAPVGGGGGGGGGVPSLNLSGLGGDGPGSRVRFKEPRAKGRTSPPATGMEFPSDSEKKKEQRQSQLAYREELERQMQEKNWKKIKEKEEQEKYDLKMEEEARNYDPFGKGGGGAPMRDQHGNIISDLRQMRFDNTNRNDKFSPRTYGGGGGAASPYGGSYGGGGGGPQAGNTTRAANSYRDDLIGPPPVQTTAEGEASFARGGHGIFGMPKTDAEKMQADKYKVDLKKQIEEKKAEEYRRRQLERLEEEKEQRLLDEQRAKMQREYEEEQRKLKEKEDEARRKNEELVRAAEEKKREAERRRRELEDQRLQEQREERERERQMAPSPPIPATRTRTVEPVAAPSKQEFTPRAQSADVLNQLAQMRAQLQNERIRVQTMLDDQNDEVDIYDPRQVQRPQPVPTQGRPEVDVFETALNRNAVAVRRTPAGRTGRTSADRANPQAAEEFNSLKHKEDSDSRKQFRQLFPTEPTTSDALESQQMALLRQQEERLRTIKERRALEDTSALHLNRDVRSSSSQLHSNSAFVDVTGVGNFPDDFEDLPRRNDSARYRRRTRVPSSPKMTTPDVTSRATFGSQSSLNVDKLARKNEDRLRRLRDLQGDDLSLYDPEDVLDRFMTKQGHHRPPSRNTLLDDTWMRSASKQSKY
ncbi:centrosome and spindle pole associated protein 1-like isoform X7 [Physella acuta]|uniref:centrosome and spindle pole associated protein 1-like isoform X7 n=1 Tax=Physella acuta TaxID=109671 RepID=UPI0027DC07C9|nr:centrosome and spindle pole associated protein 1-like isoform X7 [Physella acuta]